MIYKPLNEGEKGFYNEINSESISFMRQRYNKTTRWVVADMTRRSAYRYPDKTAIIYKDITLTYSQLESECNRFANSTGAWLLTY